MTTPTHLDERPAQKPCTLCRWAPRDGTNINGACPRCRGHHIADLADLRTYYDTLADHLTPGAHAGDDRAGKIGKRPDPPAPVRMDVLALRGPLSAQLGDAPSIVTTLVGLGLAVRTYCQLHYDPDRLARLSVRARVHEEIDLCTRHADTYAERAGETLLRATWGAVHDTRERAHTAAGYRPYRIELGPCPTPMDDDQPCGRPLWADPVTDAEVRCTACRSTWRRSHFLWIRRVNQPTGT